MHEPPEIRAVLAGLYPRALSIDELSDRLGITTARAFRAIREGAARGWVEPFAGVPDADGLRLYCLTPDGCVDLAAEIRERSAPPVPGR